MRKTIRPLGIMMCLVLFAAVHSWAGSLTVTNTFSANTQAVAADVNTNFDEVETAVNDNNTRIAAVESGKQTRVIGVCSAGYSIRVINEDGTVVCELDTDTNSGGDITAVYAGTGLSGGSTSGAATLSADTNYMQRRIGTGCSTGYAVRAVGSDGSVTCENIPQGDITGIYTYAPLTGGIASGYAYLDLATLYDTDIGDEPGVDWVSQWLRRYHIDEFQYFK